MESFSKKKSEKQSCNVNNNYRLSNMVILFRLLNYELKIKSKTNETNEKIRNNQKFCSMKLQ